MLRGNRGMYFAEPRPTRTPGTLPVSHVAYEEVSNTVPCLEGQHFLTCSFVPVVVKRGTANHYVSISHVTVSLHVTTLEFVLVLPIQQMSIRTWKDLLLPKDQDTRVFLRRDEKGRCHTTVNVSLSLTMWNPERLPSSAHLVTDLLTKMYGHLDVLLNQYYSVQAARSSLMLDKDFDVAPNFVFRSLQRQCSGLTLNYQSRSGSIALSLFSLVEIIYHALTEKALMFKSGEYTSCDNVISDFCYQLNDRVMILGENVSPQVFDEFIGQFMVQTRDGRPIGLCTESVATTYQGYEAIFGKVRVVAFVSCLLSESSLPLAWVPCERC